MYAYYANAVQFTSTINEHRTMHQVGDVLYKRLGLAALPICGSDFHSGCIHQILGLEVEEKGADSAAALSQTCDAAHPEDRGACAHAIGHGLTYVTEYDPKKLLENLSRCDQVHAADATLEIGQSCYTGVFMEYYMHFMQSADGIPRAYDPHDPQAPCDQISDPLHKQICIYWLPPWLRTVLKPGNYSSSTNATIGKFCDSIPQADLHMWCIRGIGRDIGLTMARPQSEYARCISSTSNPDDLYLCARSAKLAYQYYKDDISAKRLCALTGPSREAACNLDSERTTNTHYIAIQKPPSK